MSAFLFQDHALDFLGKLMQEKTGLFVRSSSSNKHNSLLTDFFSQCGRREFPLRKHTQISYCCVFDHGNWFSGHQFNI
jgi:hypothetical protein